MATKSVLLTPEMLQERARAALKRAARRTRTRGEPQTYIKPELFPGVVTKKEFMATTRPPRKWAVKGLLPEGVTILAAAKSVGKTWLSLNIALDIAEGRPV